MRAAEQQITDLPCAGEYEANHYHSFEWLTYERLLHVMFGVITFAVTRTLTMELEVVWPAIPYFVPPIARIGGTVLSR